MAKRLPCFARLLAFCGVMSSVLYGGVVFCPNLPNTTAIDTGIKIAFASFTLEAWICPDDVASENNVFGAYAAGGNDVILNVVNGKARIFFRNFASANNNQQHSQQSVIAKTWTHLAMVCDGHQAKVFVNGVCGGTMERADGSPLIPADVNLFVGGLKADNAFRGKISEARFWRLMRTEEEIAANMGRRLVGTEDGLVGYWPLDDGEGTTVANRASGGSPGTCGGGGWVEMVDCPSSALSDEILVDDDFVLAPNAAASALDTRLTLAPSTNFTFESWICPQDINGENVFLAQYSGLGLNGDFSMRVVNGKLTMWMRGVNPDAGNNVVGATPIGVGYWCHVAGTYDGQRMKIYRNGVLDGTMEVSNSMTFVQGPHLYLGGLSGTANNFRGALREVRYWNVVRSSEQIAADWGRKLMGTEEGLLGYWPLNESQGNQARNLATAFGVDAYGPAVVRTNDTRNPFHSYDIRNDSVYESKSTGGVMNGKVKIESSAFSLEAWVCPSDFTGENVVMAQYLGGHATTNDVVFKIEDGGFPNIFYRNFCSEGGILLTHALKIRRWAHLAATCDGNEMRFYVNGELMGMRTRTGMTGMTPPSSVMLNISGLRTGSSFRGRLSDLRCWTYARSAEEIAENFDKRLTGEEEGLLGYWPMDGGGSDSSLVESVAYPRIRQSSLAGMWVKQDPPFPFRTSGTLIIFR